jgi:hypothetical protein
MRYLAIAGAGLFAWSSAGAEAHQCFRRVVEPPQFTFVTEDVMVTPARDIVEYVPAVTRPVVETVVVRPEQTVTRVIPAEYANQDETVEVSPAHREWLTRNENGEVIGCWVNVPPRLGRISRRVLVNPERAVTETIPAETAVQTHTELVEPARTITVTIPARFVTRERQVLVAPGGAHWSPIEDCEP